METRYYRTKVERLAIIQECERSGLVMLHDDFKVGPQGENMLTFERPPARKTWWQKVKERLHV